MNNGVLTDQSNTTSKFQSIESGVSNQTYESFYRKVIVGIDIDDIPYEIFVKYLLIYKKKSDFGIVTVEICIFGVQHRIFNRISSAFENLLTEVGIKHKFAKDNTDAIKSYTVDIEDFLEYCQ